MKNAAKLADIFLSKGCRLITGGTSNHLILLDARTSWGIPGGECEALFDKIGITMNKNMIPDDPRKPMDPSGIRFGTPAITTRGMKEKEMEILANFMLKAIEKRADESAITKMKAEVVEFCKTFPVPGITAAKAEALVR